MYLFFDTETTGIPRSTASHRANLSPWIAIHGLSCFSVSGIILPWDTHLGITGFTAPDPPTGHGSAATRAAGAPDTTANTSTEITNVRRRQMPIPAC